MNYIKLSTNLNRATVSGYFQKRTMATFETLKFDNKVLRTLPIDPVTENYIREVKNACFSKVFSLFVLHVFVLLKNRN